MNFLKDMFSGAILCFNHSSLLISFSLAPQFPFLLPLRYGLFFFPLCPLTFFYRVVLFLLVLPESLS